MSIRLGLGLGSVFFIFRLSGLKAIWLELLRQLSPLSIKVHAHKSMTFKKVRINKRMGEITQFSVGINR